MITPGVQPIQHACRRPNLFPDNPFFFNVCRKMLLLDNRIQDLIVHIDLDLLTSSCSCLCPAVVIQTSGTSGATHRSTWLQPTATTAASPSWWPSVPTFGVWTMTTTPHWIWQPPRDTWSVSATWTLSPPSRSPSTRSWLASSKTGRFVPLSAG